MSESLFSQYINEVGVKKIIELLDVGFLTYYPFTDGLYIEDIFINKEKRRQGVARELLLRVENESKEMGFSKVYGSIKPSQKGSNKSLKAMLACGFVLKSSMDDAIILEKEVI